MTSSSYGSSDLTTDDLRASTTEDQKRFLKTTIGSTPKKHSFSANLTSSPYDSSDLTTDELRVSTTEDQKRLLKTTIGSTPKTHSSLVSVTSSPYDSSDLTTDELRISTTETIGKSTPGNTETPYFYTTNKVKPQTTDSSSSSQATISDITTNIDQTSDKLSTEVINISSKTSEFSTEHFTSDAPIKSSSADPVIDTTENILLSTDGTSVPIDSSTVESYSSSMSTEWVWHFTNVTLSSTISDNTSVYTNISTTDTSELSTDSMSTELYEDKTEVPLGILNVVFKCSSLCCDSFQWI